RTGVDHEHIGAGAAGEGGGDIGAQAVSPRHPSDLGRAAEIVRDHADHGRTTLRSVASRLAQETASRRLTALAFPVQAMSKAVPWSTEVRTMGRPSEMFTPVSKASILNGMWPWS